MDEYVLHPVSRNATTRLEQSTKLIDRLDADVARTAGTSDNHPATMFSGRMESVRAFRDAILPWFPPRPGLRVLDLGCGTGDLALGLVDARPDLEIVGLDISSANIERAAANARAMQGGNRPTFVTADYATWATPPFDVIVSDGALQLIVLDDAVLSRRLAGHLVERGLLLATIPDESAWNRILLLQRRLWRLMPRAADRLALSLARQAHPAEPWTVLAERVAYLRILPERLYGTRFAEIMRAAGLEQLEAQSWASPSRLKLVHRFMVWRREPDPARAGRP
jgi:trans-aconitate 2-methyltransferase